MSAETSAPVVQDEMSGLDSHPDFKVPEIKTKRYHIGVYEGEPPLWFVTLAGVTFPVMTSVFDKNEREIRRSGDLVHLTVDQVRKIKESVRHSFVRWRTKPGTGERIEANVYDRRSPGFQFEKGDEPLAKYLYLRPAPEETDAPKLSDNLIAQLDAALVEAESSEDKGQKDPRDRAEREQRTRQKRAGASADADL